MDKCYLYVSNFVLIFFLSACRVPSYFTTQGIPVYIADGVPETREQLSAGIENAIEATIMQKSIDLAKLHIALTGNDLEIEVVNAGTIDCNSEQEAHGCFTGPDIVWGNEASHTIRLALWDNPTGCKLVLTPIAHEFVHYLQVFDGNLMGHYCPWFANFDSDPMTRCEVTDIEATAIRAEDKQVCP